MLPSAPRSQRWPAVVAAAVVAILVLAGCRGDFSVKDLVPPDAATTQGQATRGIYDIVLVIGGAIFVFVEGLIIFALFRYRRRRRDDDSLPPQIHGNNRLEILWTAIPIVIVLALFGLSYSTLNTVDAKEPNPDVTIGVVAFQWQWQFVYPGQGVNWPDCGAPQNKGKCVTVQGLPPPNGDRTNWTPPTMVIPAGERIELQLHALDVIHSWYVPNFLFQRDITPGHDQTVQLTADVPGTYRGQCTQFCGLLHQQMEFQVQVVSPAEYQAWLKQKLTPSPSPAASAAPGGSTAPGGSAAPSSASPAASPSPAPSPSQ